MVPSLLITEKVQAREVPVPSCGLPYPVIQLPSDARPETEASIRAWAS